MFVKLGRDLAGAAAKPCFQLALFMVVAFVLRVATFGDPNLHVDETFYFLVGEEMHKGAIPYVDIWDRKPLGLFLLYYLIVGIWDNVIAYQAAASLFAGATAFVIARIAMRWSNWQGAVFAGLSYLLMLSPLHGFGGQAPVFYNLFIASSAFLLLQSRPALIAGKLPAGAILAMLLGAIAISVKQTAVLEAAFFGIVATLAIWRSPLSRQVAVRRILALALIGAAPTLLITAFYALSGHWYEYWQAMVTSNFAKQKPSWLAIGARSVPIILKLDALLCMAALGLSVPTLLTAEQPDRKFIVCWLLAALAGFLAVPNFYLHYALPLLVPLCVASSLFLGRKIFGWLGMAAVLITALHFFNSVSFEYSHQSSSSMKAMAQAIDESDHGKGLLVFDGPVLLYPMTGNRPLSPLAFPLHMNHGLETNVSHLDTQTEIERVIRLQPGAVVLSFVVRNMPPNGEGRALVLDYVKHHCRLVAVEISYEAVRSDLITVYGDCR